MSRCIRLDSQNLSAFFLLNIGPNRIHENALEAKKVDIHVHTYIDFVQKISGSTLKNTHPN